MLIKMTREEQSEVERAVPLFAGMTFFAMRHSGELCGSNGLPLTPNSITIFGRAQFLKTLKHPHLCKYLDVIRGKHERTVVVSEFHKKTLKQLKHISLYRTIQIARQTLEALSYLNSNGIVHRNLNPENIHINDYGDVQLFNYGLFYMTDGGTDVSFPIGSPIYTAPEVFLMVKPDNITCSGPKVDIWSLGIILAEKLLGCSLWNELKLGQCLRKVLSLLHCDGNVFERLARETDKIDVYQNMNDITKDFINNCLRVNPKYRPVASELVKHAIFLENFENVGDDNLPTTPDRQMQLWKQNMLSERPLPELYSLWWLAGGDVHSELKKQGLIRSKPPILSLPNLVLLEGTSFGQSRDQAMMLDLRLVPLPLNALVQRLKHLPITAYYPLIEIKSDIIGVEEQSEAASLPLVIRERDTEYQFRRIVLYDRLLEGYPYKKAAILKEAHKDIPPLFRGELWSALLDVTGNIEEEYVRIDKETPTVTDRQIEVDIPRCHQYNELLSSREGHRKFKRVLKAWVISHPEYVYWQGLDSLCAPFLYLNFNNEARAYACLSAFVPKYLHNFFLKDNSAVIREYLAKFSHLIAFHDPTLANHLHDINFIPELFAIPWFLTMFSHVFPLQKIFHLWDKLLLGDASFPLYVGLAILQQLRDTLLSSGFNECILLFSDLPEVDIERCVTNSIDLYCSTPRSVTYRSHELHSMTKKQTSNPELEMSEQPVSELQSEFSPRISGADLLDLLNTKYSRPKVLVIDVRDHEAYREEAVPGSINIPLCSVDLNDICNDSSIPASPELSILYNNKGKIIIVAGVNMPDCAKFCRLLVYRGFPRVCCLHGGINVLKETGILEPVMS
ncbi:TBC domain-containing protein kinase-like protein isoform X2 [Lycorma delicatula]|uniref:TBC domain-containing protein kinase-like protein isoform X2 n=1 Tax=Lycorma delicatula TaxID=130591 RepID=UPI003F518B3A